MYQDQEQRVRIASFPRMSDKVEYALAQERTFTGHRWVVSDAAPEPMMSPTETTIYRCLRTHAEKARPFSAQTVADMTGVEVRTVRTLLPRMAEKNLIQKARMGDGYYVEIAVAPVADVAGVAPVADVASQHVATSVADPLLTNAALESVKTGEQQEQRHFHSNAEQHPIWSQVPSYQLTGLRLYLGSNDENDQDRARQMCNALGIDYDAALAAMKEFAQ